MDHDVREVIPTITLMLDQLRRVSYDEVRQVVQTELGDEAEATVQLISDHPQGMNYIDWRLGAAHYHLGTSDEPYINRIGVGKVDAETMVVGPMKWTMREEVPPEEEAHCSAWMRHNAFLYVDAILFHTPPEEDGLHLQNILRIASRFVDERCVLLWRNGGEPKRVALPTPQVIASLRAGVWPD